MTIWLTLLLVWTTGIPIGLFAAAALLARMQERRYQRFAPVMPRARQLRVAIDVACGRRMHAAPLMRSHVRVARRRS
ncbi:MAG TPA: hypothetical protein VFL87_08840 [Thermoleophilaceae bacterium]|nr:hypothetical protein [Thermoleophilaceae bacterium]